MGQIAGSNKRLNIKQYPVGPLTDTIYAVPGTYEDWSYAASWEEKLTGNNVLAKC